MSAPGDGRDAGPGPGGPLTLSGRGASQLVGSLLAFAAQPKRNPRRLDAPRYTLALLAHDYPALTPAMWNACYERFGFGVRSVAMVCEAIHLGPVLEGLRVDVRCAGGGFGVGLKAEALKHLDRIDPLAEAAGAVNVLQKDRDGRLRGHNTDGEGFVLSLEEALVPTGRGVPGLAVLVLGAGGTARSVVLSLARSGAAVVVLNRTAGRAADLAARVNRLVGRPACRAGGDESLPREAPAADVIVNVSTKGAAGPLERYSALAEAPLPATDEDVTRNLEASRRLLASVSPRTIIGDVVLRRGPTPTLALAREIGLPTLDGAGMVVHQGAEAFRLLHGDDLREAGVTRRDVAAEMLKATRLP